MLEEAMRYVNNRFERSSVEGEFSVSGGGLDIDGAVEGQYFWVEGSVLNDGLHMYPAHDMADETFTGRVALLAVPRAFVEVVEAIEEWCDANAKALGGPYQSESFGGYSYSLASGGSQGNELPAAPWQARFGARLRPWRKLSRDWV